MAKAGKKDSYYIVTYRDLKEGGVHTLKARQISDSSLGLSFIAVSNFVFETNSIVVNPKEEALALHFEDVKVLHLSIYSVLSIEEKGAAPKALTFKKDKSELKIIQADFDK
jgi:hypothetical protein